MPDINVYVARAAGRLDPQTPVGSTPSQYDMAVREPCYVVVELDPDRTNWQFENGIAALTTKDDPTEDNWGLIHAYANGKHSAGKATRDGCRVIYFGVAQRTGWQSSFVNLHTEFLQASTRLKVIIDPDVPNEGPDIFP